MKLFDLAMTVRPLFLLWMAGIFVAIAWWALSPRRRKRLEEDAMIPLRDAPSLSSPASGGGQGRGRGNGSSR